MSLFEPIQRLVWALVPPIEVDVNLPNVLVFVGAVGWAAFEWRLWKKHR